jgi:hypothetical protein
MATPGQGRTERRVAAIRADRMGRREFIALVGSVAVAWPLAARAQQPGSRRRIGILTDLAENDAEAQARLAAFRQGLQQLGWTDGRNVRIDTRWGAGDADRLRKHAAELIALVPDVILAVGGPSVGPLLQATRTARWRWRTSAAWISTASNSIHPKHYKSAASVSPKNTRV